MSDSLNNDQREQLLTAYFDNELGPVERSQTESMLAEDSDLTRLLQQWQGHRDAIRELPRYSLDEGFSGRVLAVLDDSPASADGHCQSDSALVELPSNPWRSGLSTIAVLAAMLLMTLFVFPQFNQPEVAVLPLEPAGSDLIPAEDNGDSDSRPASIDSSVRQPVINSRNRSLVDGSHTGRPVDPIVVSGFEGPRVEQVLWVENKSLAELETVLARHSIKVVNPEESSQDPIHLVPMTQARVEAVYVISSAERMKRAILEMTSPTCSVSSFPLPLGFVADLAEPNQPDFGSAQQIKPMDLGGNGLDATEIASLDQWFGLVGESDPSRPIQFLLLINLSGSDAENNPDH